MYNIQLTCPFCSSEETQRQNLQNNLVFGRLLLGFTKDVDVPARLVGTVRDIIASSWAQGANLVDFLGEELDLLEVVVNARFRHTLRND